MEGAAETLAYFEGTGHAIHLHLHRLERSARLRLIPLPVDRLAYVWEGAVEAGGHRLDQGSSFIIERGAVLDMQALCPVRFLIFAPGHWVGERSGGGHAYLLPRDHVPRIADRTGSGTTGALHADGTIAGLWLNENNLAGRAVAPSPAEVLRGIHAHPADEIIFIVEGAVRLGNRLYPPGTALAIAADTLYGFSPGPEGVHFITFRTSRTDSIRFAAGGDYRESTYFRDVGPIPFLTV